MKMIPNGVFETPCAYFLIFGAKFCFQETCMMMLFGILAQLSVEP